MKLESKKKTMRIFISAVVIRTSDGAGRKNFDSASLLFYKNESIYINACFFQIDGQYYVFLLHYFFY